MKYTEQSLSQMKLSKNLDENIQTVKDIFAGCYDFVARDFYINKGKTKCAILYIDGTVNKQEINDNILKPLMANKSLMPNFFNSIKDILDSIKKTGASISEIEEIDKMSGVVENLLNGFCVLLADGEEYALTMSVVGYEQRKTGTAEVEPVLRGSVESFVENLNLNTALLRRSLKTHSFKLEKLVVGRISKTNIAICYLDGIADNSVVEELKERINRVDVDVILEGGYLEQLITDQPLSPFPLMEYT